MIKIAFFDIDGTLIKIGDRKPSEKIVYTLNKLQSSGVLLCMATGRPYTLRPYFEGIDFDITLSFNGSYIVNKKEVIYKAPLDKEDLKAVINNLSKMNRPFAICNEKMVVANDLDKDLKQYFDFSHAKVEIDKNIIEYCKDDIYQILAACNKKEYETILEGTTNSKIAAWWDRAADVIPKKGDKGIGIEQILKYYGITKEEAIAFGDGDNDIEMLTSVAYGVAMGNANENVKKQAKYICKSVEEDGIYDFCLKNNFITFLGRENPWF